MEHLMSVNHVLGSLKANNIFETQFQTLHCKMAYFK